MDVMNDINELTKLEDFPPEIFHLIFDYLTGDQVLKSFSYLNNRFTCLMTKIHLNTIDFSNYTHHDLIYFFKNFSDHMSTYSHSLKLTNQQDSNANFCSAHIEFIFSSLLDSYQIKTLVNNIQQIIFLRPIIDPSICLPNILLQSFLIYSFNEKIIFKKELPKQRVDSIMICSEDILRLLLTDNNEISNQILIYFQNPLIQTLIPYTYHLKFYIDNYEKQWNSMLSLIIDRISVLTLLIIDNKFEDYHGETFSLLLNHIPVNCQLQFYLEVIPNSNLTRRDIDLVFQSYQIEFFLKHQANVTISYCRNVQINNKYPLVIYTSPFCATKFSLLNNQDILGICSDYTNITRLILDPYFSNYGNIVFPNNQLNLLTNVISLEFIHGSLYYFNHMILALNNIFQQISRRLRHIHFHNVKSTSHLIENLLSFYTFPCLRYLDLTDNNGYCTILSDILRQKNFCTNIFHLNISGLCYLKMEDVQKIGLTFCNLQTLKFPVKLNSKFEEQLDTIGQYILINMHSHLHYVHIYFEQDRLLNLSTTPSETQLSEWLGHNQERLLHVQAIELNRRELAAWM